MANSSPPVSRWPYAIESDLPENLKGLVATGNEVPYSPAERNIYELPPHLRRQAREIEGVVQWQSWCEERAAEPLPPGVEEVLQAEHDKRIGHTKAQMAFNQDAVDAAYEVAAAEAAAKETQYYVRRGGEMARVQNARLKPGETCFVRRPNGEMEAAGHVDAYGQPPDSEITL